MYQGGVLGWSTNGNLEIAYGPKVNANWEGQVLDTVSDSPQTYTQSVSNMVMGAIYTLKFSYAAKSGLSLASQAA